MITPAEVTRRAARLYLPFLRAWLRDEVFFPIDLPVGKLPTDYLELSAEVARLLRGARSSRGRGYVVRSRQQHTQRHGTQSLPERVRIESERDLLHLLGKSAEFAAFRADVACIREALPQLEDWLIHHPERVVEQHGAWPDLLRVCAYFLEHPRPDCFPRELPVAVHTKFVETHTGILRHLLDATLPPGAIAAAESHFERRFGLRYDEPLVRLRFLDDTLRHRASIPVSDLATPLSECAALPFGGHRCLIVENKLTFLTLPPLPDTLAIFGGGFHVSLLAAVPWLATCPVTYWGDLDAQGFQILSLLRSSFPAVTSLMMDQSTLDTFRAFAVPGTPSPIADLPHLTPSERAVYTQLARDTLRLEQEHIPLAYATAHLTTLA